jgi:DUF1680 family protein
MPTTQFRAASPAAPSTGTWRPLGINEVEITGGFWGDRQRTNSTATLAHIRRYLEQEGWLPNFDLAATGALPAGRRGREFSDSEVYKYLEASAWELGRQYNAALEEDFSRTVARVAAAQEADGYVGTAFGRAGQEPRWSDLEWGHELYCLGFLFQAAVARTRTRPEAEDGLLAVATRAADLVCDVFGAAGRPGVCGHPEIETALTELFRVTGERRYLDQASLFVERRGHRTLADIEWGPAYFQDETPVREAGVLRGHAVRANYLAAGAADVAAETDDSDMVDALARQWDRTTARRTYITGGQGSRHADEAFGADWALPADRAYSETCAGVASIQFSWRLLLAKGESKYADLIERTLFNVVATSPSHDGTTFYYANTLHQREPGTVAESGVVSKRAASAMRAPWFEVSCCPPNVARTLASLAAYVATASANGIQIQQYAPAVITTRLDDTGRAVALEVQTEYPHDGRVRVVVRETPADPWTLSLRIPSWALGARMRVIDDAGIETVTTEQPGYASVTRSFAKGDVVEVELPMDPRFTSPDPRIDAVRGCVAIERGPEVFCLESVDLDEPRGDLSEIAVDTSSAPVFHDGGVFVVGAKRTVHENAWPYGPVATSTAPQCRESEVRLIPYHDWSNRGPSTMRVWIPISTNSFND